MAGISWDDAKSSSDRVRPFSALVAGALAAMSLVPLTGASAAEELRVIIRAMPGAMHEVVDTVAASGGEVERELALVDGLAVTATADELDAIRLNTAVVSVTPNTTLRLMGFDGAQSTAPQDLGVRTVEASARALGVETLWSQGLTGAGVDVAIIDSGLAAVPGFDQVVHGPDLSIESEDESVRHVDTFGHGTHLAGIIAGYDAEQGFTGLAPDARIVSVKVADRQGLTDVSQVIAAIDWVVEHRRANGLNIRVLNLAFGTDGAQSYRLDPLSTAVEKAWHAGIAVVVAAGNNGSALGQLNNPATNPYVIAVGASDVFGTDDTDDDTVPSWSSVGNQTRQPDLVAPGVSVVSLRAPGSTADTAHASARVADRLFVGSGTSQSTAFVSGALALLFQQKNWLDPDRAKETLRRATSVVDDATTLSAGAGELQLDDMATISTPPPGHAMQRHVRADASGSLEGARGSVHISRDGVELRGEHTVFGAEWDGQEWLNSSGSTWSGSTWSGSTWSSGAWMGSTWSGSTWSGSTWSGSTWSGSTWSGSTWSGSTWSGSTWSTVAWG